MFFSLYFWQQLRGGKSFLQFLEGGIILYKISKLSIIFFRSKTVLKLDAQLILLVCDRYNNEPAHLKIRKRYRSGSWKIKISTAIGATFFLPLNNVLVVLIHGESVLYVLPNYLSSWHGIRSSSILFQSQMESILVFVFVFCFLITWD